MAGRRVDSGVGDADVISYLINKYGYDLKIQADGITLGVKEDWLQFSKKSVNIDQLEKVTVALGALKASGELDSNSRSSDEHEAPDRAPRVPGI